MIRRVRVKGDEVDVQLRFKMAVFSTSFSFVAGRTVEEGRRQRLTWRSGEPRGAEIEIALEPKGQGTEVRTTIGFDLMSLDWLVSLVLRHHPEIRFGVFPGSALALLDTVVRAAE